MMSHQPTVWLLNPPIYDFAAYDLFNKPLGLLYLASMLERSGFRVWLLDAMDRHHPALTGRFGPAANRADGTGKYHNRIVEKPAPLEHIPRHYRRYGMPSTMIRDLLQKQKQDTPPVAVLVTSMMTYWYPGVREIIKLLREEIPGVPVGLGGVYASLFPEHARRVCGPDRIFKGQDFTAVVKWLNELAGDKKRTVAQRYSTFADWPRPAYELYPRLSYLTLLTSVGCPFRCDYCASGILQPRWQQADPDTFVTHLVELWAVWENNALAKGTACPVAFMDDALLVAAEKHLVPLLEKVGQTGLPLRFYTPNGLHCRFLTPPVAEAMRANRFEMIRLSYEASDAASRWQQASDHKVHDQELRQAVGNLVAAGFTPGQLEAYILTGLPGQTLHEARESARMVHELGVKIRICQYTPIPGTALFDTACRTYGIEPQEPLLHNNTILPFLDRRLAPDDFQAFNDWVLRLNREVESDASR